MAIDHPRLLAASLTVALFCGVSCSTSSNSTPAGGQPNPGTPTDGGGANATKPAAGIDDFGAPQGQGQSLDQQRRAALVQKYLGDAQQLRGDGKLDAALVELLKAKELQPANAEVRALIAAIQAEKGLPAGTAGSLGEEQVRLRAINEERRRASVTEKLQSARGKMDDKNYAGAVEDLRLAQLDISTAQDQEWGELPRQVVSLKADAEKALDQQNRRQQEEINDRLSSELRAENEANQNRIRARVDNLLQQAQMAFAGKRFQHASELALAALKIEPNNAIAADLHNAAMKAGRDGAAEDYYLTKAREIRKMLEAMEELKVPQTEVMAVDADTWERALRRARANAVEAKVDPADQAVYDKIKKAQIGKLNLTEETGAYGELVKKLTLLSDVPIIITPEGRQVITDEKLAMVIDLVNSISLDNFLNLMTGRSQNLAWTVKNGVVVIGNKSQAAGTLENHTYDVQDLIFKRTQFLPPRIRDIPGDGEKEDTPRTGGESEDKVAFVEMDQLVNNIKEATDLKYWEGEGVKIEAQDRGFLVITASPDMHRRVVQVMADMRRFATSAVTVDSKFLTVTRNFLQEVGVDFRGLGGSGNKGTAASLDDVTNGLQANSSRGLDNGGTGDPAANPLSGAFYNDGGDGDVRARTENFFTTDLGKSLTTNGGLTAGWSYINDIQFNMILRAIEKQEDAEVVNSQIISVMDNERGHVAVINQTAYVRDFDVEVAQASFIADPKVDVIQDGVVLDVKPVIQQDRKYIILDLSPTVAELTRPIPTFTTSLAGSTLPVTLQLPNLTVTNFSTTAKVPDGGTVLIGGLRTMLSKERRAEIPVLAQLPLISFLFKQEGTVDENRSLMVMVTARITDIRDLVGK